MAQTHAYDAIVIGSGPNGLAAAITLAQAGCSTLLLEAKATVGGGMRSAELTLPDFVHDICSAIHPLGVGSPFFRRLPLADYGLEWIYPPAPLAHPLDDGTAVVQERSIEATSQTLGPDAEAYCRLMTPLVADWGKLVEDLLGPFPFPPRHPPALARFGLSALRSARGLAESRFQGERARALFAGLAAHSIMPLEKPPTASFGLVLGILGHALGWPLPKGGSQRLADALAAYFQSLGGEISLNSPVESLDALPPARAVLFDVGPRQFLRLAGDRLPAGYRRQLEKYRYGPGVFKVDFALDGPIPWRAAECLRAGTVHVGGPLPEVAASERAMWHGSLAEKPFVLVVQQSLFDATRAPAGQHTAWAYCHVPSGCPVDMTGRIEA
ncbi:MAG: NAD(P)/FAD-dependent oxidoreductase, partial [Anaerolineales bacterium]|nr:NAD(P)/FAD-dependent oxidoreductase [Anaerolineales bacterium]